MICNLLNSKKLSFFALIFILFICTTLFSQSKKEIFGSTIWLKTENNNFDTKLETKTSGLLNFNPQINLIQESFTKKIKNSIQKQSSLFLVFKTDNKDETNLILLERTNFKSLITSKKIISDNETLLNKGDAKKGTILSYLISNNSELNRKNGSLTFDDAILNDKENKTQLMELIYIPKVISENNRNKIESYLSIKYGISLLGEQNYTDSRGTMIWEFKSNKDFKYRVTGIGNDAFFDLNQKQSGNSDKEGLYIGVNKLEKTNAENKNKIENQSFLIWSDNNKSVLIGKNDEENEVKKMDRVWKIQTSINSLKSFTNTEIKINKKEMIFEPLIKNLKNLKSNFWMVIDSANSTTINYTNAKYIKSNFEDDENLIFNKVNWEAKSNYLFTFIKAPRFFAVTETTNLICNIDIKGNAKIKIVGGISPYIVKIVSKNYDNNFVTNEANIKIENLVSGKYQLNITDKNGEILKSEFLIDSFINNPVSLNSEYYLENNKVVISPIVNNSEEEFKFEWILNDKTISTEKSFTATSTGSYKLYVTNLSGCKKEIVFDVKTKLNQVDGQWIVFPNPVKSAEDFSIQFRLKEESKVVVTIDDLDGRILDRKDLNSIKEYDYKNNLLVAGTYLVVVSINGEITTTKLLVK